MKKIKKIWNRLNEKNIDAILITNPSNIFYLTDLRGACMGEREFLIIVSKNDFKIITSGIYRLEIKKRIPEGNFIIAERNSLFKEATRILEKYKKIGFEKEDLKYGEYEYLKKYLKGKLIPNAGFVEDLRKIKDREEIERIKKAATITDKTFYSILKIIKPGLTEKYIQRKIIEIMEDFGAEGVSFEPIVASGKNSAEIHHQTSNKKIKNNEILLIDMGARYKGYCSDFTRTVFIGRATQKIKKLYNLVLETQERAIKNCKVNGEIKKLYEDAVLNFKKYKEDKYFTHSLGHGVGINIHEFPNLGSIDQGNFKNKMVFTIEPGLYHKNFGGIRIEDLCLMDKKCKILSKATKKLIEIN